MQSLDLILAVIHLAYKKMIHEKFVQNLVQNSNLKRNVGKCERVEVYSREVRPKFSYSLEELKLVSFDGYIFKKKEVLQIFEKDHMAQEIWSFN